MYTRRRFLRETALTFGAALTFGPLTKRAIAKRKSKGSKPNFLIVLADDMGFSDAGCYGGEIRTPNLDNLAENGIRFTQFYSTGRCWPSRTAILTGYYPQQVNMDPVRRKQGLPQWAHVLPRYLKPHGYRCYHSGKWHLFLAPRPVADGGFDHSYVTHDHNRHFSPKRHALDDKRLPPVKEGSGYYSTTAIADYGIDFLKEHQKNHTGKPWALYLAFISPHFPLHAPKEDIARYKGAYDEGWDVIRKRRWKRMKELGIVDCGLPPLESDVTPPWNFSSKRLEKWFGPGEVDTAVPWKSLSEKEKSFQAAKMEIHAAMIDRIDRDVGRVLKQVKAMGDYEDTVVVFMSDNGASAELFVRGDKHDKSASPGSAETYLSLGPGWSTCSNTPLRLHKSWVHEGGIASPLIVHWPKGIKSRGKLRHTQGHFIDVLPTMLDLAGEETPRAAAGDNAPPLPGRSLVPALGRDRNIKRPYIYFHHMNNKAIRVGDWKLVSRTRKQEWELYNLKTDRCEVNDLSKKYPDKVKELAELWLRYENNFKKQATGDA